MTARTGRHTSPTHPTPTHPPSRDGRLAIAIAQSVVLAGISLLALGLPTVW